MSMPEVITRRALDPSSNPFAEARERLNLSHKELAEKLNSSFYTLMRWERGDQAPTADALARLMNLLDPSKQVDEHLQAEPRDVFFASTGARTREKLDRSLPDQPIPMLDQPRETIIGDLVDDDLWGDGDLALADILSRCDAPAITRDTPFSEEVSAGKNTYTYDAHTYHTKVPPQGIARIISKYLPEGGVVLDPFAGSGMTGVAAKYLGYDVILNELSPAACFIAHNFLKKVDTQEYSQTVNQILENLTELRAKLYSTDCRECGANAELQFTVWSYELECNHCHEEFVLWDHCRKYGKTVREHKLLRKFPCPHCGNEVNKSYLKRRDAVPVFVGYKCCSKKIMEHELNDMDRQRISDVGELLDSFRDGFPNFELPDGVNLNQPKRHGLDSIEKFYTPRNLIACAAIWKEIRRIENPDLAAAVGFAFTSLYQRVTRLSEYRFWGGSGNTANFNVPQISNESNVFITFERKAKSIADHFLTTASSYGGRSLVRTGSASDLSFLPENSVDLIFTDPPFGGNINYSEMNILWESWLGKFTDATSEAIMNRSQGKGVDEYQKLMTESLSEAYRVLRPGHWMVLVFMNSSEKVWTALRNSIESAGFSIEEINIFDKQHGTFKQFVSDNTAGADLMLHCKKLGAPTNARKLYQPKISDIASFLESCEGSLPILPFLHVQREAEIDYRTLYSRYIAKSLDEDLSIVSFASFRAEAARILESR
ncbi:DNA methyltransferase [Jannaschia aquimarina]|uniref:site-specific DNA-methyltransferase (adenine-specific) n=1 Tax=Jannaschia aquimarina TaxID=935700 RepID=A0A0D1CNS7_9RHOB|nr:DNA methyltransferase [Jannaschia aquimarina]KIT16372.1 putative methyltransferase [Jannaschia aquimarina]SNT05031.1 DNA methylase [Jannaschia aquimarina]